MHPPSQRWEICDCPDGEVRGRQSPDVWKLWKWKKQPGSLGGLSHQQLPTGTIYLTLYKGTRWGLSVSCGVNYSAINSQSPHVVYSRTVGGVHDGQCTLGI